MRAHGEGTVYRRKDGRWCAQITVTRQDGSRGRKTLYGTTQREVLARRNEAKDAAQRGVVATRRPPTVAAYSRTWLHEKARQVELGNLAESTLRSYEDIVRLHVVPHLGRRRIDDLPRSVLSDFLIDRGRQTSARGRPLSATTVRYIHSVTRAMLGDAVRDGLLMSNPMSLVRPPRQVRKPVEPPTHDEVSALFAATDDDRLRGLWITLCTTGLRLGEAIALTWRDVDLDSQTLSVTKTVGPVSGSRNADTGRRTSRKVVRRTKTPGSEAEIALSAFTVEVLRAHRATQTAERLAQPYWVDNDLVFTTPLGTVLDHRNLGRAFTDACARAGIARHLRLHDLRHAAASFLIAEGVSAPVISGVLRHTRISTTIDIYGHLLKETKRGAADAMDNRMRRMGVPPRQDEVGERS